MKIRILLIAAVAGGLVLANGIALGEEKRANCNKAGAPEWIDGEVTQMEAAQGRLTVRAADGAIHEFETSPKTLEGYKVGAPIKAKLRPAPRCD
jgi:hypothetical protein